MSHLFKSLSHYPLSFDVTIGYPNETNLWRIGLYLDFYLYMFSYIVSTLASLGSITVLVKKWKVPMYV